MNSSKTGLKIACLAIKNKALGARFSRFLHHELLENWAFGSVACLAIKNKALGARFSSFLHHELLKN